jgi:hypothetical protein
LLLTTLVRQSARLALFVSALAAQAQVAVWAPSDQVLRSGDTCILRAGAATAAELAWQWSLPAGAGTLAPAGDGTATYTAPFVLEPQTFRVRAVVASELGSFGEVSLRVDPPQAFDSVGRWSAGWWQPRTEPFVGPGGLALDVEDKELKDPVGQPDSLLFIDRPNAGMGRSWLFADWLAPAIRRVTETGRVARLLGKDDLEGCVALAGVVSLALLPETKSEPFRLLFTERGRNAIRSVDAQRRVAVFAGTLDLKDETGHRDGPRLQARFSQPRALAVDRAGNVYLVDIDNQCIRRIDVDGTVSTLFRLSEAQAKVFNRLGHLVLDEPRGVLYLQHGKSLIRVGLDGEAAPMAGSPGVRRLATEADLKALPPGPTRLAGIPCLGDISDLKLHRGRLYIVDSIINQIFSLDPDSGELRSVAGSYQERDDLHRHGPLNGPAEQRAALGMPRTLAFDDQGVGCIGATGRLSLLYLDE